MNPIQQKSSLTIWLSLVLVSVGFLPRPVGSAATTQSCSPQGLRVMIVIPETIIRLPVRDPAAETEMIRGFIDAGFTVLDPILYAEYRYSDEFMKAITNTSLAQAIGKRHAVQVVIIGEAFAETSFRDGRIVVSRARVEARAVKTEDATLIGSLGLEATARDISEAIAGKAALHNAGQQLGDYMITRLAKHYKLCPTPRLLSRTSTAVVKCNAPGLPSNIDFGTILSDEVVKLGTVDVVIAGQDLETVLSSAHAGLIPVPDVAIICSVEQASIVNLGSIRIGAVVFYVNLVTLRISVRAANTETGLILGVVSDQKVRQANDVVISIGGITVANFDRTVMGQLAREMLKGLAAKIVPYVLYSPPAASYFDIITARNGDRVGGTVLNPNFTISTSLGQFTVPTSDIKTLVLGDTARITRTNGSTLSGQLRDTSLIVSDLGTIPMSQIATVVFAIK